MRFIHLSDLHLGKRLLEQSFIEDQKYILKEIITIIKREKPDGVIIAGDIYDKSVPSAEAVEVFDWFLSELANIKQATFVISGNHDSAERIAFGSSIFGKSDIHISPVYNGSIYPISLNEADIWLLPFIKPSNVKSYTDDESIKTYDDAIRYVINHMDINEDKINILVAHQFVTSSGKDPEKGGSEELTLGGLDNVDVSAFDKFDYVALGHIHKKQTFNNKVRYSGTPLKYSFSEVNNKNSLTLIDISKGKLDIAEIELKPKRNLVEIKGTFDEVTSSEFKEKLNLEDYYHVILTDEEDIPDGASKLRGHYPYLLRFDYDNTRTKLTSNLRVLDNIEEKSTIELFDEFYVQVNGLAMSDEQREYMLKIIEEVKGA